MERSWKREELQKMKVEELKSILKNKGQSTTGLKEKLIQRILGESAPKLARKSISNKPKASNNINKGKYKIPEIIQESPLTNYPRDILLETLYLLGYEDVVKTCRTSQKLNRVCDDEKFWEEYAKRNNIEKLNKDTWKITVQKSSGKISPFATPEGPNNSILNAVGWILSDDPYKTADYYTTLGTEIENHKFTNEDWNKIVFKDTVKVAIPYLEKYEKDVYEMEGDMIVKKDYGKYKKGDILEFIEPWNNEDQHIIEIKPNTNYGSTLRHVLDSLYRGIWELPKDEKRDIDKLISDVHIDHPYFEGLILPREGQDYYELAAGS